MNFSSPFSFTSAVVVLYWFYLCLPEISLAQNQLLPYQLNWFNECYASLRRIFNMIWRKKPIKQILQTSRSARIHPSEYYWEAEAGHDETYQHYMDYYYSQVVRVTSQDNYYDAYSRNYHCIPLTNLKTSGQSSYFSISLPYDFKVSSYLSCTLFHQLLRIERAQEEAKHDQVRSFYLSSDQNSSIRILLLCT